MSTELINLNEATRRLMKAVRLIDTSDEVVSELSGKISDIASEAEKHTYSGVTAQGSLKNDNNPIERRDQNPSEFFPYSPAVGPFNPIAPPLKVEVTNAGKYKEIRAFGKLDGVYVGPPDLVQGGVIALLFDDIIKCSFNSSGSPKYIIRPITVLSFSISAISSIFLTFSVTAKSKSIIAVTPLYIK